MALAAMVNNKAHKHESQGDDHPDLSFALRWDWWKPRSLKDFEHPIIAFFSKTLSFIAKTAQQSQTTVALKALENYFKAFFLFILFIWMFADCTWLKNKTNNTFIG